MSSEFGKIVRVSVFGQSHGSAIGILMDGLPVGEAVDEVELLAFMERRKPKDALSTARKEQDIPQFLSGFVDGKTCGSPLCALLENKDVRSQDYEALKDIPRPSHADYAAYKKYGGQADMRGGGHFSGRLTAALCIGGGIAKQILARRDVFVGAHLLSIAGIEDEAFGLHPGKELFAQVANKAFPTICDASGTKMQQYIKQAAAHKDSVGGVVECAIIGMPAGLGSPLFEGIENRLAQAVFGIPAVKGIEFGKGFASTRELGSDHNDPLVVDEQGEITHKKNNAGGINGGISNGMPIRFNVAFKPTPSIGRPQQSVNLSTGEPVELTIEGRHDPCVAHRAVPVVEAVAALVILDILMEEQAHGH